MRSSRFGLPCSLRSFLLWVSPYRIGTEHYWLGVFGPWRFSHRSLIATSANGKTPAATRAHGRVSPSARVCRSGSRSLDHRSSEVLERLASGALWLGDTSGHSAPDAGRRSRHGPQRKAVFDARPVVYPVIAVAIPLFPKPSPSPWHCRSRPARAYCSLPPRGCRCRGCTGYRYRQRPAAARGRSGW